MNSLFLVLFLVNAVTRVIAQAPTVNLGYAQYSGFQNATIGINYYRGLRFAVAPVGDLRWREPVPIEQSPNYTGQVIDASQYGPACYQGIPYSLNTGGTASFTSLEQSEDCLLLDVLVPIKPVAPSLPVYVQIHGGGYTLGSSSTVAPGDAMVNASNGNLIYVQIQYRWDLIGDKI
jgi:carboxylesterase type B